MTFFEKNGILKIHMETKIYDNLPEEAKKIRMSVFIEEQKFATEFDDIDGYAKHLVVFDGTTPIATCRFYCEDTKYIIGRIAVVKEYRGKNIGSLLLQTAEKEIVKSGGDRILLHSQYRAKEFYEKNGYAQCSELDYDEDCPHIWMSKKLNERAPN